MIISNITRAEIKYNVQDKDGTINDGGTIRPNGYIEYEPRGNGDYKVSWSIDHSPERPESAIVTFWSGQTQNGGGFSE